MTIKDRDMVTLIAITIVVAALILVHYKCQQREANTKVLIDDDDLIIRIDDSVNLYE